mmetsp:Transcript_21495/g.30085  ORF Transcript_21495/g.30085 Transcript_21495/m.30085 type:complete len:205 (-) Transcript_21495:483-1097(-)
MACSWDTRLGTVRRYPVWLWRVCFIHFTKCFRWGRVWNRVPRALSNGRTYFASILRTVFRIDSESRFSKQYSSSDLSLLTRPCSSTAFNDPLTGAAVADAAGCCCDCFLLALALRSPFAAPPGFKRARSLFSMEMWTSSNFLCSLVVPFRDKLPLSFAELLAILLVGPPTVAACTAESLVFCFFFPLALGAEEDDEDDVAICTE